MGGFFATSQVHLQKSALTFQRNFNENSSSKNTAPDHDDDDDDDDILYVNGAILLLSALR